MSKTNQKQREEFRWDLSLPASALRSVWAISGCFPTAPANSEALHF